MTGAPTKTGNYRTSVTGFEKVNEGGASLTLPVVFLIMRASVSSRQRSVIRASIASGSAILPGKCSAIRSSCG